MNDFKKVPDKYKNAPIYDMTSTRGQSRRNRRKDVVRDQNIRRPEMNKIKNLPRDGPKIARISNNQRQSPSNNRPGFLSTILSPLNPFKSLVGRKCQII